MQGENHPTHRRDAARCDLLNNVANFRRISGIRCRDAARRVDGRPAPTISKSNAARRVPTTVMDWLCYDTVPSSFTLCRTIV